MKSITRQTLALPYAGTTSKLFAAIHVEQGASPATVRIRINYQAFSSSDLREAAALFTDAARTLDEAFPDLEDA